MFTQEPVHKHSQNIIRMSMNNTFHTNSVVKSNIQHSCPETDDEIKKIQYVIQWNLTPLKVTQF
jgi:hypothetical protein